MPVMAISSSGSRRHLAQLAIEGLVADEEAGMQDGLAAVGALDRALAGCRPASARGSRRPASPCSRRGRPRTARARRPPAAACRARPSSARNSPFLVWRRISACASASENEPMPICSVPPSLIERRRVQRHGVVGERHRLLGRGEQVVVRGLRLQHHVDLVAELDLGLARHVGQVGVDLDRRAPAADPPAAAPIM